MSPKRKQKRRERRRSGGGVKGAEGLRLYSISSPFAGMDDSQVAASAAAMGSRFAGQYEQAIVDVEKRILSLDPLQTLAMVSLYVLTTDVEMTRSERLPREVSQSHGELIQALALRSAPERPAWRPVLRDDFQGLLDAVHRVSQAFALRRLSRASPGMSREDKAAVSVTEHIRLYTQGVRNWGYPNQTYRLMTELFAPFDDEFEQRIGVRVGGLATMGMKVIDVVESRIQSHVAKLRPMLRARGIPQAVRAYHESFSQISSDSEETIRLAGEQHWTTQAAKSFLLSHSDLFLADLFTFSLDDFAGLYPGSPDLGALQAVLDRWSFSFGDLAEHNVEHFFMGNPVWRRPIIRLGEGSYFWPIVGLFLSFGVEMMEELAADLGLANRYERRRAQLLEQEVERYFRQAFPRASVFRGSQWHDTATGKTHENDLLVVVDSHLLVVEAKSARVPDSALRGGEQRLKHVVDELIVAPSQQSQRFAEYLDANRGLHRFLTREGTINEVDTSRVTRTVRLSVTLERMGDLIAQSRRLQEAGIMGLDATPAPTTALPDLETVFTVLDTECRRLHYLARRAEFGKHASYAGDESDLLAFYLDTGFNVGELEFDGTPLRMLGMGGIFDPFFIQAEYGIRADMPAPRITKWWQDVLSRVEHLGAPRWSEVGCRLLNVGYEDQVMFERMIRRAKRTTQRGSDARGAVVLVTGPRQRRDLFVALCYRSTTRDDRNWRISQVAGRAMEERGLDSAVVMGIQADSAHYPYDVLMLSTPPSTESGSSAA